MPRHEFLLHVGSHKTGTTAIQAYMSQCRPELAAQGILYPSLRPGLWKEMAGHHKIAQAVARHSIVDRFRLRRYRRWIDHAQAWARVTVLSAEPIYRHVVGRPAADDMPAWFAAHDRYLRRFSAWLAGFDVRPVLYLRQPDELAVSLYKEHAMRRLLPHGGHGFGAFLAATAPCYEYSPHIDSLKRSFGSIVLRDYAAAHRAGLQADFAALVGADNLPPPARSAVRSSPGNRATLWLAAQPESRSRRGHYRRVLFALRAAPDGPFSEPEPTTLWPGRATFERFVERHRASWDLPFLSVPAWRDASPAAWTPDDDAAAEAGFRAWEARNIELLQRREALGMAFYEPDPD